jgi:hypothetical protein
MTLEGDSIEGMAVVGLLQHWDRKVTRKRACTRERKIEQAAERQVAKAGCIRAKFYLTRVAPL